MLTRVLFAVLALAVLGCDQPTAPRAYEAISRIETALKFAPNEGQWSVDGFGDIRFYAKLQLADMLPYAGATGVLTIGRDGGEAAFTAFAYEVAFDPPSGFEPGGPTLSYRVVFAWRGEYADELYWVHAGIDSVMTLRVDPPSDSTRAPRHAGEQRHVFRYQGRYDASLVTEGRVVLSEPRMVGPCRFGPSAVTNGPVRDDVTCEDVEFDVEIEGDLRYPVKVPYRDTYAYDPGLGWASTSEKLSIARQTVPGVRFVVRCGAPARADGPHVAGCMREPDL